MLFPAKYWEKPKPPPLVIPSDPEEIKAAPVAVAIDSELHVLYCLLRRAVEIAAKNTKDQEGCITAVAMRSALPNESIAMEVE